YDEAKQPPLSHKQPQSSPNASRTPTTPGAELDVPRTRQLFGVEEHPPGAPKKPQASRNTTPKQSSAAHPTLAIIRIYQVLKELDVERAQRQQTEQLCRDLTQRILRLEASAVDETKALEATNQLKQAFTAERRARLDAETRLRELDARLSEILTAIDTMRIREEVEKARISEEVQKVWEALFPIGIFSNPNNVLALCRSKCTL
ncbi:hypothetical protein AHF37_11936, partial [Paragonimus kellicotti]